MMHKRLIVSGSFSFAGFDLRLDAGTEVLEASGHRARG